MIRKSTNLLLTRTLSHCLQYGIKKKNVGLAEVTYVCSNNNNNPSQTEQAMVFAQLSV